MISTFKQSLDWSPDGKMLAILFSNGVQIWDWQLQGNPLENGGPFEVLRAGHSIDWGPLDDLIKVGDLFDSKIAIGGNNGDINVVQIGFERKPDTDEIIKVNKDEGLLLAAHNGVARVVTVLWSPDGKRLASSTSSIQRRGVGIPNDIKVWDPLDLSEGEEIQTIPIEPRQIILAGRKQILSTDVFSLAWRADKRYIAAGLSDGSIRVFNKIK